MYIDHNISSTLLLCRGRLRQALQLIPPSPVQSPTARQTLGRYNSAVGSSSYNNSSNDNPLSDMTQTSPNKIQQTRYAMTTPGNVSTIRSRQTPPSSSGLKKSPQRKARTPKKPLYSWERSAEKELEKQKREGKKRGNITYAETGELFIPSVCEGFYEKHGAVHSTPTFIDFQVVLSPENYEELLKRRRRKNAESLHVGRFGTQKKNMEGGEIELSLIANC